MSGGTAPNLSTLSADLRGFAETYRIAALPNAANILDDVSSLVESGKATRSTLDEAYQELTDAVRKDWRIHLARRKDVLDDVDAILSKHSPSPTTLDALKAMLSSDKALHTCTEIIALSNRVADREGDIEVVMHLLCFVYLILLEGAYNSTLRFLYAHYLQLSHTRANIADIRKKFDKDHIGRSLFEGWNRTVRNAIAHATYSLDKGSLMVEFEDQDGTKQRLRIPEFQALVRNVYDVNVAVLVLLILRIFVPPILSESLRIGHS